MANTIDCSNEHAVDWVRLDWREPSVWKRYLVSATLATVPGLIGLALGAGIFSLALFALGALPWPARVGIDREGVQLRWWLLRERWPVADVARISVIDDPRRWAWPKRAVLVIERHRGRPAMVFGPKKALRELADTARRLGLGDAGMRSLV